MSTQELTELYINKWARSISKKYEIETNAFRIMLEHLKGSKISEFDSKGNKINWYYKEGVPEYPVVARVTNGIVVHIVLTVPWVGRLDKNNEERNIQDQLNESFNEIKSRIRRIFKYLSDPELYQDEDLFNPLMISDTMHEYIQVSSGIWKWTRKKFDPSLVHGHRFREFEYSIKITKEVELIHKKTGVNYKIIDKTNRLEWDLKQECWMKCAELVEIELEERELERQKMLPVSISLYNKIKEEMFLAINKKILPDPRPSKEVKKSIFSQLKIGRK